MAMKIQLRLIAATIVAVLCLAISAAIPPSQAQGNPNSDIIPVNKQYQKLAAEWWQWAFSFPVSNNPLFDLTGESACLGDQGPGNVFFLAGVFNESGTATRNITVPSGSRLFFPLLNVVWDNVGVDPPFTVQQLYEQAAANVATTTELHATIDGRPVQNLFGYRAQSAPFCYTLPATDNVYQFFGAGDLLSPFACSSGFCVCPAVADGYWLLTTPLPVGQHTINFGGSNSTPFTLDITYNITVVPRGQYQGCQ